MVISVGYRVSSAQATLFRRWATSVLVQFARKGFVEVNLYRELRNICSLCQDYDGSRQQVHDFYQRMQAKLIYAVTSYTPAEIIHMRADSTTHNMGLQTWPNDRIRKGDVSIAALTQEVKKLLQRSQT